MYLIFSASKLEPVLVQRDVPIRVHGRAARAHRRAAPAWTAQPAGPARLVVRPAEGLHQDLQLCKSIDQLVKMAVFTLKDTII